MISNFGQIPSQLFKEPHPSRLSRKEILQETKRNNTKVAMLKHNLQNLKTNYISLDENAFFVSVPKLVKTTSSLSPLILVTSSGVVSINSWLPYDRLKIQSNYFTFEKSTNETEYKIGAFHPCLPLDSKLISVIEHGKLMVCAGFWDNTIRAFSLKDNNCNLVCSVSAHCDLVTCIAVDILGAFLVSGSRDTTAKVWELNKSRNVISSKPFHTLHGHDNPVADAAITEELDMVVTSSKTIINVYTLKEGIYLRTLDVNTEINRICLSYFGHIISQSGNSRIDVFAINGTHIYSCNEQIDSHIKSFVTFDEFLVIGGKSGILSFYNIHNMKNPINKIKLDSGIKFVTVVNNNMFNVNYYSHLLVTTNDAKLVVITAN